MNSGIDFDLGEKLSKNHKGRSRSDTQELYKIIQQAVEIARLNSNDQRSEQALNFLLNIFMPHINRVAYNIWSKLSGYFERGDIEQEVKVMFITLLDKYKKDKSAFPYYIGRMLPRYMYKWYNKEKIVFERVTTGSDLSINFADPLLNSQDAVLNYLNKLILEKEYVDYIKKIGEKKSRSQTIHKVCHNFFLSSNTCSEIARDQNISYHAVYEVIGKVKKEVRTFLSESIYADLEDTNNLK